MFLVEIGICIHESTLLFAFILNRPFQKHLFQMATVLILVFQLIHPQ